MKFGKKLLFSLLVIVTLISLSANAQKSAPVRLGIGLNAGSTLKTPTFLMLGADARLQVPIGNSFSVIATTGYYHFFETKDKNISGIGIVPIKAGLKYFPVKNVYIAGEVGAGIFTKGENNTSFVYSPSVGLAFANGFDISLKYEDYTDAKGFYSPLALRFAYGFKL